VVQCFTCYFGEGVSTMQVCGVWNIADSGSQNGGSHYDHYHYITYYIMLTLCWVLLSQKREFSRSLSLPSPLRLGVFVAVGEKREPAQVDVSLL